jgi:hypothetical protein
MLHEFRNRLGVGGLRQINDFLREDLIEQAAQWDPAVGLIDATDLPAACRGFKKKKPAPIPLTTQHWEAAPSRPGQAAASSATRNNEAVLLVPLVSWITSANVSEGGLLVPSLHYCAHRWSWWPTIIVADMGYIAAGAKQQCRQRCRVAVVTKLRANNDRPLRLGTKRPVHKATGWSGWAMSRGMICITLV